MKFRNRAGDVYDIEEGIANSGFCAGVDCHECDIACRSGINQCTGWVNENPEEAAKLMGYELIKEETMEKPRICEVLGVEVNEKWLYKGYSGIFRINENGIRQCEGKCGWLDCRCEDELNKIINHPELISKIAKWSHQEVEYAKMVLQILGSSTEGVFSYKLGEKKLTVRDINQKWHAITLPSYVLPSMNNGEAFRIEDIANYKFEEQK